MKKRKPRVHFIILAGGSRVLDPEHAPWRPKLLEQLNGEKVLHYVIQAAKGITTAVCSGITVIISSTFEEVLRDFLKDYNVNFAVQEKHRGTADAVLNAIRQGSYPNHDETDYVVVLMGDQPLVTSRDIDQLISGFDMAQPKNAGIISFREDRRKPEFQKCGVIIRERKKFIDLRPRIPIPRKAKTEELHAGPYIFNTGWLLSMIWILGKYQDNFPAHVPEFHLYDPLLAAAQNKGVHIQRSKSPRDFLGVDTCGALKVVRSRMKRRMNHK